jgi:hypothetical protein
MTSQGLRRPAVIAAAVAAVAVVAAGAFATVRTVTRPASSRVVSVERDGHVIQLVTTGGPDVPQSGAYLGAYVRPPAADTAEQRIEAVLGYEQQLGHRLGLVHLYHPWGSAFPDAADRYFARRGTTVLISWGGAPDTRAITAGRYDTMIRKRAVAIKALGRPVLLMWRGEMDRPNLRRAIGSPAAFVAAWRHIRSIFAAAGVGNAGWVWCPTAAGFAGGRAPAYYPGDSLVDWICADGYAGSTAQPLGAVLGPFLGWAAHHPKPVLIGEFAVGAQGTAGRAAWIAGAGQLARGNPQIKALAYFDADAVNGHGASYFLSLRDTPAAFAEFGDLLTDPYFNPAAAPAGQR